MFSDGTDPMFWDECTFRRFLSASFEISIGTRGQTALDTKMGNLRTRFIESTIDAQAKKQAYWSLGFALTHPKTKTMQSSCP